MRLINTVKNRLFLPFFIVNSLPKSGTHLLVKALQLLPGVKLISEENISASFIKQFFNKTESAIEPEIPIGVDWPRNVSKEAFSDFLLTMKRQKHFVHMHTPYSEALAELLLEFNVKTLTIIRDPRDVVVSHAKYIAKNPSHFLYPFYQNLNEHDRIRKSITGITPFALEGPKLIDIRNRFNNMLMWHKYPLNYLIKFEDLIGQKGGGEASKQVDTITGMINHLQIHVDQKDIKGVCTNLFGGTTTFDKGQVGSWKTSLSANNKKLIKEMIGDLLIDENYEKCLTW